ncbi:Methionyl-tRNA formyltransferase [Sporomusa paucivorans]|uniref:Methionyl-tRNA formyltransferase n=2 Tax=Sporomusaceae TaxID=1843490 RepID=A0ABM9WAU7_9FIRM|nr:methionyl-tRNA formyltransferase [Sporomusa sphaeroides DSM 2875]CVK21896.1 Methionyl-tRNA formyltransferase [Sporomusa sphaeroides DSM 2875]
MGKNMLNIIVSNKKWHKNYINEIETQTNATIIYIDNELLLTYENLKKYSPKYVFFPHWSNIISEEIYKNFECVIFHMTDLPFGRGGSPLQNLIARGIYETKLAALRCEKELDAGDIYLKMPLSLQGAAEEIYLRAADLTKDMMIEIINKNLQPKKQEGEVVTFERRKPEDGDIGNLQDLQKIFDYIRMLDADSYPRAFLSTENLHLEFERATLKHGYIKADVKIALRIGNNEKK